ncbi:hypothetical protein FIBSPDRAFT_1049222 [Athelia psychrophila]|uniref:Uncharacterized protein n=1 Tax=Athelia psychrophila TaxID=1759441 RepID=A0A166CJ18_9AGAM|nr:hypothetical protein FIBSPDRAFT_1049222 [Fibularhizoctonia sp. CBS 109695]
MPTHGLVTPTQGIQRQRQAGQHSENIKITFHQALDLSNEWTFDLAGHRYNFIHKALIHPEARPHRQNGVKGVLLADDVQSMHSPNHFQHPKMKLVEAPTAGGDYIVPNIIRAAIEHLRLSSFDRSNLPLSNIFPDVYCDYVAALEHGPYTVEHNRKEGWWYKEHFFSTSGEGPMDVLVVLQRELHNIPVYPLDAAISGPMFEWCVQPTRKRYTDHMNDPNSTFTGKLSEIIPLERKQIEICVLLLGLMPGEQQDLFCYLMDFLAALPLNDDGEPPRQVMEALDGQLVGWGPTGGADNARRLVAWLRQRWDDIREVAGFSPYPHQVAPLRKPHVDDPVHHLDGSVSYPPDEHGRRGTLMTHYGRHTRVYNTPYVSQSDTHATFVPPLVNIESPSFLAELKMIATLNYVDARDRGYVPLVKLGGEGAKDGRGFKPELKWPVRNRVEKPKRKFGEKAYVDKTRKRGFIRFGY